MSDENNIIESPIATLRRKVEILEEKVKNLQKDRDHRVRMELVLIERYEESRKLFIQAMELYRNATILK